MYIETGLSKKDEEYYLKKYKFFYREAKKYGLDVYKNPLDIHEVFIDPLNSKTRENK